MDLVLTIGFSLITLLWMVMVLVSTYSITRLRDLPAISTVDLDADDPPKVTAVIATRDEADHIENTIRGLLAQRHVDLSVVVVNDGSRDATRTILDRMAETEDRLHVIHIDTLPEGWIGKCYAVHRGAAEARGRWIMLTDADVRMASDVIARAVAVAEDERAHHVCLMPCQRDATLLGKASLLMLFLGMPDADVRMASDVIARAVAVAEGERAHHVCLMPCQRDATLLGKASLLMLFLGMPDAFRRANRDKQGVGFGAFNLVRTDAFRDIGGYETLRMEVVDDHQLGLLLFKNGKRTRGIFGGNDVEMDFARTPGAVVRAVEKNAFAIIRYRIWIGCLLAVVLAAMVVGAVAGPFTGTMTGTAAGVAFLALGVPGVALARRFHWPVTAGLLAAPGLIVVLVAAANSVVKTLRSGGVRWRDRFYPLGDLRRGMVRP